MPISVRRRVTLKDIGRKLGLSERAVSQALSDNNDSTVKVAPKTRDIVQKMAKKMGYRRDISAQSLRTGKTGLIGVISSRHAVPFSLVRLNSVCQQLAMNGRTAFHYLTENTEKSIEQACEAMLDAKVDGVLFVVTSSKFSQPAVNRLLRHGIAVSSLGMPFLEHVPKFIADKKSGARHLTAHLIEQGYRSITLLARDIDLTNKADRSNWHVRSLVDGFHLAAKSVGKGKSGMVFAYHRLSAELESGQVEDIHPLYVPGYMGMKHIIEQGNIPEALICQVDLWAQGAIRACAEVGMKIPDDLAIAGFEDDPFSTVGVVPLTSVAQPHEALSKMAVDSLLRMVNRQEPQKDSSITVPCQLKLRLSTSKA